MVVKCYQYINYQDFVSLFELCQSSCHHECEIPSEINTKLQPTEQGPVCSDTRRLYESTRVNNREKDLSSNAGLIALIILLVNI